MTPALSYRPCVGLCLFNKEGKVFVGERIDSPGAWQMPQGGIDEGEDILAAAMRELKEEIGTDKVELIRIHDKIIRYDIPEDVRTSLPWGDKYAGQEQTWVAFRFIGNDSDIVLDAHQPAEFSRYQWIALSDAPGKIVPFKVETYTKVAQAFADIS